MKFWAVGSALAVHGAIAVVVGHGGAATSAWQGGGSATAVEVEVEVAPVVDPARPEPQAPLTPIPAAAEAHEHRAASPAPSQAAPSAEAAVTAPGGGGEAAEAPAIATEGAPPRFSLSVAATAARGDGLGSSESPRGASAPETLAQERVGEPARLLSSEPTAYPEQARADGREAAVTLELVVGTSGVVETARVATGAGQEFDEAAQATVRSYKFSPARHEGKLVRVRLLWTVEFRLR